MIFIKNYKNYVFSAMMAALILMATMFIQLPTINGYVHIGDAFVYLAAAFLPMPFSLFAAGIGSALADVLSSFVLYAPFTLIIKALMAVAFSCKGKKIITKRNLIAIIAASAINIAGYAVAEFIILSISKEAAKAAFATSLATIYGNLIQSVTAAVIFVVVGLAFDKMNFKKAIDKISSEH